MGRRRYLVTLNIMPAHLSKLWVSIFSGVSLKLVSPLIDSLRHDMVARHQPIVDEMGLQNVPFQEAVKSSVHRQQISGEDTLGYRSDSRAPA